MFEPSCPNCGAEKLRKNCLACGYGTFPTIEPIEVKGPVEGFNTLRLELVEVDPDERVPVYRQFVAKLINVESGEVREQTVAGQRFARGWRDTAERRMLNNDPDSLTPQTIVSMKWDWEE